MCGAPNCTSSHLYAKRTTSILQITALIPRRVNYLLRKYATDQKVAEYDAAILRNMQSASMTFQQYGDDLITESGKVIAVYVEVTLSDGFIERDDQSIRYRLQNYWASNPQAESTNSVLKARLLLAIPKRSGHYPIVNKPLSTLGKSYYRKPFANTSTTNSVNTDTASSPSRSS